MEGVSYLSLLEIAQQIPNDSLAKLALELKIPLEDAERYQKLNKYDEILPGTFVMLSTWKRNTKKEDEKAQLKRALEKAQLGGIAHQYFGLYIHINDLCENQYTNPERFSPNIQQEVNFIPKPMYRCGPGRNLTEISRHDIFSRSGEGKHRRRIVVSGDSIAKNTALSHILAYDWATQNQASPLSDKQLVFELSANLFSRNQTMEAAIKQQLFRDVDEIDEASIRQILDVMPDEIAILVDGFHGKHIEDYGDNIMKVLTGRALQDVTVMVTAQPRSANLLLHLERGGGKEEGKPERIEQTPSTCVVTAHHIEVSSTSWENVGDHYLAAGDPQNRAVTSKGNRLCFGQRNEDHYEAWLTNCHVLSNLSELEDGELSTKNDDEPPVPANPSLNKTTRKNLEFAPCTMSLEKILLSDGSDWSFLCDDIIHINCDAMSRLAELRAESIVDADIRETRLIKESTADVKELCKVMGGLYKFCYRNKPRDLQNSSQRDIHAVRNEATHQPAKDDDKMNVTGEDMTVSCQLGDSITLEEEPFSSMNARNDQPTTGNEEKLEKTTLSTPLVDHPKSYEGNPSFTRRTSLGSECKKTEKKRQSANNPCSSFRGQIQSLLHWIIAPAIILAGSPVFAAGEVSTEQVTIQVGQHAMIPFDIPNSPDNTSQVLSDFTLRFWSKPSPFYINGEIDIEGFKSPSQFPRFNISVAEMTSSICVKVNIDLVDLVDQDRYVLIASVQGSENVRSEVVTKNILVQIPPGPAKCFITLSENNNYPYEAHCHATTGSMITTLTCYQYGQRVKVKGDVTENGQVTRRVFLLPDNNPFSCCSHDAHHNVNENMCNDFEWLPNRNSIGSPNVNDTTLTPSVANTVDAFGNAEKESQADSATCKQCMTSTVSLTIGLMISLFLCF